MEGTVSFPELATAWMSAKPGQPFPLRCLAGRKFAFWLELQALGTDEYHIACKSAYAIGPPPPTPTATSAASLKFPTVVPQRASTVPVPAAVAAAPVAASSENRRAPLVRRAAKVVAPKAPVASVPVTSRVNPIQPPRRGRGRPPRQGPTRSGQPPGPKVGAAQPLAVSSLGKRRAPPEASLAGGGKTKRFPPPNLTRAKRPRVQRYVPGAVLY